MIILGFTLLVIGLLFLLSMIITWSSFANNKVKFINLIISISVAILGIAGMYYDITSPTEKILINEEVSNQLNDLTFPSLMKIKTYEIKPIRFMALYNNRIEYELDYFMEK